MMRTKVLTILAVASLSAAVATDDLWLAILAVAISGLSDGMKIIWREKNGRK